MTKYINHPDNDYEPHLKEGISESVLSSYKTLLQKELAKPSRRVPIEDCMVIISDGLRTGHDGQ